MKRPCRRNNIDNAVVGKNAENVHGDQNDESILSEATTLVQRLLVPLGLLRRRRKRSLGSICASSYCPTKSTRRRILCGEVMVVVVVLTFLAVYALLQWRLWRLSKLYSSWHLSWLNYYGHDHPRMARDWSWWNYDSLSGSSIRAIPSHHEQPQQELQKEQEPWMIFYNVYIPNETSGQEHALAIIAEQMAQVRQSYAANGWNQTISLSSSTQSPRQDPPKELVVHLYYNTIGTHHVLTPEWMQHQFTLQRDTPNRDGGIDTNSRARVQVHFGHHFPEANEDVTLQDLYDFCKVHEKARVIYLHSKGTFHYNHPTTSNNNTTTTNKNNNNSNKPGEFVTQDRWRQLLTAAATSRHCLEQQTMTGKQEKENRRNFVCDTCSLLMQPLPSCHYPGNMWVASCRYIQKLVPPMGFDTVMDRRVVKSFKHFRDTRGTLQTHFFPQMPHMMGRKRFASEHWLGSHPSLLHPCHVTSIANLSQWLHPLSQDKPQPKQRHTLLDNQQIQEEPLHMVPAHPAPGFPIDHEQWDFYRYGIRGPTVLHNDTLRRQDYFLLPGQLLKWYQLYGAAPPLQSWVWHWFPDGLYWQRQVLKYSQQTKHPFENENHDNNHDKHHLIRLDDRVLEIWNHTGLTNT